MTIPGHILGLAALFCVAESLLVRLVQPFGLCYPLQPPTFLVNIKAGCSKEKGIRRPHVSQYIQGERRRN